MDNFERQLAEATDLSKQDILGALAIVVDDEGKTLYRHAAGRQFLGEDAPLLDADSTVSMGSAGKVITHIAALQLVERGVLELDAPVYDHLPELKLCKVIEGDGKLREPSRAITLRHLLLHASGLSEHEAIDKRFGEGAANRAVETMGVPVDDESVHMIARMFTIPLLFDPGEGFAYGNSIHWTQLLVTRASGAASFVAHVQSTIFYPLGMKSSSYTPRQAENVWQRRLQMVERVTDADGKSSLVDGDGYGQGLACSISDVGAVLSAVLASSPVLLKDKAHYDLLLTGQFAPDSASLRDLRGETDNYGFVTGKASGNEVEGPTLNWSGGGLVVEDKALPVSSLPPGTVTWEGMPNVMWAVNRERKRAAFFATQLVPVGDPKANALALSFMHNVWNTF